MVITPNPFKDPLVSREMDALNSRLYMELRKYGKAEPKRSDLTVSEQVIRNALQKSLRRIAFLSFDQALTEIGGYQAPASLRVELENVVKQRAADAAHSIIQTTSISFGIIHAALSKKQATGKDRTKNISQFEGPRIFFESRRKGWGLRHGVRKAWYCQKDPCELCQENEDDGPILVNDTFSSGDIGPPMHLNCECLMSLII